MDLPSIKNNGEEPQRSHTTATPSSVSAMYEPPAEMLASAGLTDSSSNQSNHGKKHHDGHKDQSKTEERFQRSQGLFYSLVSVICALGIVWVVVQMLNILATPVAIILWTVVIVFVLRGPVAFFEKHGISRGIGTGLAYILLIAVFGLIVFLMVSPAVGLGDQMHNLIESIPSLVSSFSAWTDDLYSQYSDILSNEQVNTYFHSVLNSAVTAMNNILTDSASGVMDVGTGLANGFMSFGFGLVIAFWMLTELPALGAEVNRFIAPNRREDAEMLHVTCTRIMGGYITATIIQCVIIAVLCGILFAADGTDNPMALGCITGILNVIPVVGPWFGGAIAAISGLMVSPLTAVISLVGTIVLQQLVYTFVSPRIMGNSVDIHPALMLVALMTGSALGAAMSGLGGSLVGALVAIPAVAVLKAEFAYYFEKNTGRKIVSEDGVFFKGTPAEGEEVNPLVDATSPRPDATNAFGTMAFTGRITGQVNKENKHGKGKTSKKSANHEKDN